MSRRLRDPRFLVSRWKLQGNADDAMGRYHGTLVNTPTWDTFLKNNLQAIRLNGTNEHVNVGDVIELNEVSAFTIAFWMNQDVIDQTDVMFRKFAGNNNRVSFESAVDGNIYANLSKDGTAQYGLFDYSTVISALNWHHIAMTFDGSGAANADRLKVYVDGIPIVLTFTGTIQTTTDDLSGVDATFGYPSSSFDGKFQDYRLYNIPLTQDEILKLMHSPVPTY